ncbi:MAG: Holliday junction resolvase RuvX [Leptolyngbyaceae cyanobacterium SM1_1_3]|nr:Holliday junction resolvase RuvX [Leptolyngbyaceae cyanobacterium SM1_1_3]NJN02593.1 Holliday junction resolvase RuvX [Leptolyngbyaceae cyanobacterium RM1_1_2]NJO09198.1 Holliday junction resolvase RuvX [Leptolyngbyaceae cyanobacterium SL_1_1]
MLPAETNLRQPVLLGFDPGRDKCGIAVMGVDRILRHREVVTAAAALDRIQTLQQTFPVSTIVLGDQTTAKTWRKKLMALPNSPRIIMVDERNSSLEARDRYWQIYPPKGLQRLLPQGMRNPPSPIDDIVAILLIERYLNRLTS